jgi:3-oxoacyl-[acyl-carrier protein] reductase
MDRSRSGNRSIVVTSSIRAQGVRPKTAPYSATKAALNQLVRVAAYELGPSGVRINSLSPGLVVTPMSEQINPDVAEFAASVSAVRRATLPADIAEGALFLCRPSSSLVTGTNLVIDGGEGLW